MSIKVKRGLAINLPTLEEGELGFTTDSYEMYVGSDNGNILLNNGEILIRRNNCMLQYAQSNRKNQWFDICSLEEIRGDQGVQGIQGLQGVKGDKGDKGERGIQGEKGNPFTYADFTPDQLRALKGEKGDTGAKGERGLTGDKGDRGVGLNYSWSGTRLGVKRDTDAQYTYVDLRGADGKDGKQGERGERGIQGEKGDTPSIAHLEKQVSDKSKELDTKFNTLTAKQQQDSEVISARDGEVSLHARLERDLAKGKIHFVGVEGSSISTESEECYLEDVEIHGNTWQDAENLADIRSVGDKVEGHELYKIDVTSRGKNVFNNTDYYVTVNSKTTFNYDVINNTYTLTYSGTYPYIMFDLTKHLHRFEGKEFIPSCKFLNNNSSAKNAIYLEGVDNNGKTIYFNSSNGYGIPKNTLSKLHLKILPNNTSVSLNGVCEIENIQIEEGTQATPYEPYQEDKLTILSPTPLEKVGDVADRIICKGGVWGVEKNIKDYAFNTNVRFDEHKASNYVQYYVSNILADGKGNAGAICNINDCFISMSMNDRNTYNKNYISCWTSQHIAFVTMPNMFDSVATFKSSLPKVINFKYVTTQSTFIPLPHDQQIKLRTFANKTNISFDTEIQPTIKAQVPKSLGATVNTHTTQIDNLNKELDRVKKLEESTVSTVTSNKAFTTVAETNGGYFEDVKIEGKTLVNKFNYKDLSHRNMDSRKSTEIANGIRVNNISGYYVDPVFKNDILIKPNTTYTLFWDYKDIQNSLNTRISIGYRTPISSYSRDILSVDSSLGKVTFTTESIFTDETGLNFRFARVQQATTTEIIAEYTNIILLEGDHTDKDITFFEGLKSVGQDTDEISVSSVNNDYFNYYLDKESTKTYFRLNKYITTGAVIKNISQNPIKCLAYKNGVWNKDVYLRKNEVYVVETEYDIRCLSIATGDNWNVSKDYFLSDIVEISVYKQDKKQILYFNPTTQTWEKPILREWDSIEKHSDGKYYYHKRSGEVVLNGSENITIASANEGLLRFYIDKSDVSVNGNVKSDRFNNILGTVSEESIYLHPTRKQIVIVINASKLSTQDIAGFKQWLQANPVTIVYQLAQEEVYECTNLDLITYSGETNLIVNSGAIQPKLELKVLSNVSNVVKLLQEKVSILENKFIKGLQQVLAGDMMSLAHLLYPEDFTLENDTPQVIPYIEEGDINE